MQQRSLASSLRRVNIKPAAAAPPPKRRMKKSTTTTRRAAVAWLKMLLLSTPPPLLMSLLLLGIAAFSLDSCSCYAGKFCLLHVLPLLPAPIPLSMHIFLLPLILLRSVLFLLYSFFFFFTFFRYFMLLENKYKTNSPWEFVGNSKRSRKLGKTGRHSLAERVVIVGVVGVGSNGSLAVELNAFDLQCWLLFCLTSCSSSVLLLFLLSK